MERLVNELNSLLKMLDHETVSPDTANKMASVRNILDSLQLSVNGSDIYMNGTSFVESLFEDFDCDLHMLSASPVEQKEPKDKEEKTQPSKSTPTDTPPPLPATQCNNTEGLNGSTSPIIQRKLELDKMLQSDRQTSDSDSGPIGDSQSSAYGPGRDIADSLNRAKRGAFSELTGSMSRAAGKKINRIITFSKKKPPLPGDPPSSSGHHDNPRCGYLSVCLSGCWKERWCVLRGGNLYLQKDPGDQRPPVIVVPLKGAEVVPGGLGPKHPFSFHIMQAGNELAALEASSSEDLGRWLGILFAETGSGTLPEELHYDYIDVDTLTDIRQAARHSFLWATTTATSSSSASIDSRTYDEVYESIADEDIESKTGQVRRHASFSSRDSEKTEQQATIKRHASNVNPYGRYGKMRAEEDARRYLRQKEELEKQKEELRNTLISLRREKKEVKEQMKSDTGDEWESKKGT
ncbi:actin filament-associated protein 1-like 1 [Poecilia reticulata]|uniref:actin filament-associated protein 1-like 1 n=1 Tax=Poecilia reticulata TaxID=8081 RepID=UPI0004A23557|nr:PREDICTED: actin filament-associated protein 1-like 1 [Poecilia reticulata]